MSGKQLGFSDYELTTAKKQTKREKFLSEMEVVVTWQALIDLIEPHYPKASKKGGRPPYALATMLRVHLLQQWYSLGDFQERCHSSAALQAAFINGSCCGSSSSSSG